MRYHYFIQETSDIRNGEFDVFVMVPVMRTAAERQAKWQRFVGESGMHSFLCVPINEGKLRFSLATEHIGRRAYPVLKVDSPSSGQFTVPFLPSQVGAKQAREAYEGIMGMAREYKRKHQKQREVRATGTGGASNVAVHPAASERVAHEQMERFTQAPTSGGNQRAQTHSAKKASGTSQATARATSKRAAASTTAQRNSPKSSGIGRTLKITGAGVGLGAAAIAAMMAVSPVAAAEEANADKRIVNATEAIEQAVAAYQVDQAQGLPLPETGGDIAVAKGYDGCSVGSSQFLDDDQSLSALSDQADG